MAEYALEEPCEFIYRIKAVTKVVDGDTVDCVFDLGFDVMFHSRVRLLGIDTPESRTRHKNEKIYGKLSKKKLKEWVHWAVESDRDDIDIELRCPEEDSRGKFGRILGELWVFCGEEGHEYLVITCCSGLNHRSLVSLNSRGLSFSTAIIIIILFRGVPVSSS